MFFSGKKKSSPKDPGKKPLVTVGSLFNPNLGATLRPLGETGKMLTGLIATIFAANGLFPRNHPALLGVKGANLSLREVIATGWNNLTFTREKLPQTLIFFAVLASIGCSVLAILGAFMGLLTGTAHAQVLPTGPSMFVPPSPSTDIALGWINWLFFSQAMPNYLSPLGQALPIDSAANTIQTAFLALLGFYSDAILVVAAVVLFYHLTSMIVETAHHGVVMGRRANQIWAPIRLVAAIGLLVPIGSGLNSGQYIVLQVAAWGSGLASNAWAYFLSATAQVAYSSPAAPYDRASVTDTYLTQACAQAYNQIASHMYAAGGAPQIPSAGTTTTNADGSTKVSYSPIGPGTLLADEDLCGSYVTPAPPQTVGQDSTIVSTVSGAVTSAFGGMQTEAINYGESDVECFIPYAYPPGGGFPASCPYGGSSPITITPDLEQQIFDYENALQSNLSSTSFTGMAFNAYNAAAGLTASAGWASAGSYWNTIARTAIAINSVPHDSLIKTEPPQVSTIVEENKALFPPGSIEHSVMIVMRNFNAWANEGYNTAITGHAPPNFGMGSEESAVLTAAAGVMQNGGEDRLSIMDTIFQYIDMIASLDHVWQANNGCNSLSCFTLGVKFSSTNPLAEIARFGQSNINVAYDIFDDYIVLQMAASTGRDVGTLFTNLNGMGLATVLAKAFGAAAHMGGEAAGAVGTILGTVVVLFFTGGFLLAYFLPLIPFYRFLFGILSWFLSLLEAVIAVPLIALAHLTPEGEGFTGDRAKQAYYYLFGIFLRPTLMIFGLITGFLLFSLTASAMNLLYSTAIAGAGGLSYGHFTLGRLVYSILYVVILYLLCNRCFQVIDWLPEHAIQWMGAQGAPHAPMGDPMEVGGYMGLASGYVERELVGGAGKLVGGPAGAAMMGVMANNPAMKAKLDNTIGRLGNTMTQLTGSPAAGKATSMALTGAETGSKAAVGVVENLMGRGDAAGKAFQASQDKGGNLVQNLTAAIEATPSQSEKNEWGKLVNKLTGSSTTGNGS